MKAKQNLGPVIKELVSFSLPLILSGVLQQLYNWADAFIVGNVDGELSLSAIGATTTPINFFITTITGFTLGLSVLIAKNFGAGKRENVPPILAAFAVLLCGVFLIAAAAGSLLAYPFMALLHTPPETIQLASGYIRVIFIGLPFLAVYNVYTATLRGIGDSRIPFLSILLSSGVNVLLDILFVAGLRWGVGGAATATVLSQAVMTVFIVPYGSRRYPLLNTGYRKESFCGAVLALAVSLLLTVTVIPTGGKMIALFGAGAAAVSIGSAFFRRIACFYPVFGLTAAFRGYLEGKGDLAYSSLAGMSSLAVRITASYAMAPRFGNMSIAYAEMLSWVWLLVMYLQRFVKTEKFR